MFIPAARRPFPHGEREERGNEEQTEDKVALFGEVHAVFEVVQQRGLHDVERRPGEQENAHRVDEGTVLERGGDGFFERGLFLRLKLGSLARAEKYSHHRQDTDDGNAHANRDDGVQVFGNHRADDGKRTDIGDHGAGDGECHAIGRERGALVVVGGQFGGQRKVGHVEEGRRRVIEYEGETVINCQTDL